MVGGEHGECLLFRLAKVCVRADFRGVLQTCEDGRAPGEERVKGKINGPRSCGIDWEQVHELNARHTTYGIYCERINQIDTVQ